MTKQFKLNFPVETKEAQAFWASKHKCNRLKAIIAFSLNEKNAIDNMRRHGFQTHLRQRALAAYKQYIASPTMTSIPFSEMEDEWWNNM